MMKTTRHPLARVAYSVIRPGTSEAFALDDEGIDTLRAAILAYRNDLHLKDGIRELLLVAMALNHQYQSMTAASRIIQVIMDLQTLIPWLRELSDLLPTADQRSRWRKMIGDSEPTMRWATRSTAAPMRNEPLG